MRFPTEPDEVRRWIKVRDRNERIDDARWWTRGNGGSYVSLTDSRMARLATPSAAEDAVYLSEVVDALERMSGAEQAAWFLSECDRDQDDEVPITRSMRESLVHERRRQDIAEAHATGRYRGRRGAVYGGKDDLQNLALDRLSRLKARLREGLE